MVKKRQQVVAFGSLHKRTFNWNDCTFYMSVEHAQQLQKVVFVQEAGRELEANEEKPDWAGALAGAMASWASENVQSMLNSEYEAAIGALS